MLSRIVSAVAAIIVFVSLLLGAARAEGFTLNKVGPMYEPESLEPAFTVPGRKNMKAGAFRFVVGEYPDRRTGKRMKEWTAKAGVLVNDKTIYYVESSLYEHAPYPKNVVEYSGPYDPGRESRYGVWGDYLVMDSWVHEINDDRIMYLFRLGGESVELLDAYRLAYQHKNGKWLVLEFMSVPSRNGGIKNSEIGATKEPVTMRIGDFDGDGNPEIMVSVFALDDLDVKLYLEIRDGRIRIDTNPKLYKPLFEREKKNNQNVREKNAGFYVYGYLARELELDKIRASLKEEGDGQHDDRYARVMALLEDRDIIDKIYHFPPTDERAVLKKYEIPGR